MKLVAIENGTPVLRPQIAAEIADFERQIKHIEKRQKELKEAIKAEMEANGIIKIETDDLIINYIAATEREKFDVKTFKEEFWDIYDEYTTMTPVKSSIRIRVK